ncbi:MAG TPA: beta-glucosidase [Bacteroidales bacterium]|nr:beta-glucosidase [Bacteroidales bacterium]
MKSNLCICIIAIPIIMLAYSCNNTQQNNASTEADTLITDDSLLTLVQYQTFRYFWEGAEPVSGMARERIHMDGVYPQNDQTVITTGGSGFGIMAILVGIERGFITRQQGLERLQHITDYLKKADRFHGIWSHWIYGETGKVKPFGTKDNGADGVESAYLMQGLLTVREYLKNGNEQEQKLAADIDKLWREMEWTWLTKGGKDVLYWHWSPEYQWQMNFPVEGYNECLIFYVLAASSPTYAINADVYHKGWARSGKMVGNVAPYGLNLNLKHNGAPEYGGPLFWSHYSFLGLDPRKLEDQYANYWEHNRNHALINYNWCVENKLQYKGYGKNCWGLTASYSTVGYAAHAPGTETDLGVISPTAALASFPYTPEESMAALKHFYFNLNHKIWGEYGFYDAFSEQNNWYPNHYLAIDQGPIPVMIENYRTGLLWNLFMGAPEIKEGLNKLGFKY